MHTAGIVAEYNPFHLGHAYQLAKTRQALGEDATLVCVMSGNFVQRGEAAILDKWTRATGALRGGADLVLELPLPWSISSAEAFARGAVETLAATGVVDTLSFGCEDGQADNLKLAAECLLRPEYGERLREALDGGKPFAAARQAAVRSLIGGAADCLGTPNNNLAVEYLKAIGRMNTRMDPLAILRVGAEHDGVEAAGDYASASAIRARMQAGEWAWAERYLPAGMRAELERSRENGGAPATLLNCQRAVLARLRAMTEADFAALPDGGGAEGLSHRLVEAVRQGTSLEQIYDLAKTKRYAHARIRRLVLWAFLGLTAQDRPEAVPYIRVLGMNEKGRAALGRMRKTCTLPVIVKPAHAKRLDGAARRLFELEARSTDLYALCTPTPQPCGQEWLRGPVVVGTPQGPS